MVIDGKEPMVSQATGSPLANLAVVHRAVVPLVHASKGRVERVEGIVVDKVVADAAATKVAAVATPGLLAPPSPSW